MPRNPESKDPSGAPSAENPLNRANQNPLEPAVEAPEAQPTQAVEAPEAQLSAQAEGEVRPKWQVDKVEEFKNWLLAEDTLDENKDKERNKRSAAIRAHNEKIQEKARQEPQKPIFRYKLRDDDEAKKLNQEEYERFRNYCIDKAKESGQKVLPDENEIQHRWATMWGLAVESVYAEYEKMGDERIKSLPETGKESEIGQNNMLERLNTSSTQPKAGSRLSIPNKDSQKEMSWWNTKAGYTLKGVVGGMFLGVSIAAISVLVGVSSATWLLSSLFGPIVLGAAVGGVFYVIERLRKRRAKEKSALKEGGFDKRK